MQAQSPISTYLNNIWSGVTTTLIGMGITIRYFFTRPVTFQYPEKRMPVAPRFRGIHFLEQDVCIACRVCERACPIDCIEIRFTRHPGNVNEWFEFSLDYNKCMFCELCVHPCPVTCIHQGREYNLVKYDRKDLVLDLLTWKGLRETDKKAIEKAKEEKKRKAEEAAARKKAKKAEKKKKSGPSEPGEDPSRAPEEEKGEGAGGE